MSMPSSIGGIGCPLKMTVRIKGVGVEISRCMTDRCKIVAWFVQVADATIYSSLHCQI